MKSLEISWLSTKNQNKEGSFIENDLYNDFRVEIFFMAKWKTL